MLTHSPAHDTEYHPYAYYLQSLESRCWLHPIQIQPPNDIIRSVQTTNTPTREISPHSCSPPGSTTILTPVVDQKKVRHLRRGQKETASASTVVLSHYARSWPHPNTRPAKPRTSAFPYSHSRSSPLSLHNSSLNSKKKIRLR